MTRSISVCHVIDAPQAVSSGIGLHPLDETRNDATAL